VLAPTPAPLVGVDPPPNIDRPNFVDKDGVHSLHDLGDCDRIQLLQTGQSHDEEKLAAIVPLDLEGFDRLEAIYRLLASLHGRTIPPDTRLTRQQRTRLRRMLQAFDGRRAGATQQEIAQIIFNIERLGRDEWQASWARQAIKSLLRDARAMIAGGYRKLLRHRHRK
jgi:hypothetical protein